MSSKIAILVLLFFLLAAGTFAQEGSGSEDRVPGDAAGGEQPQVIGAGELRIEDFARPRRLIYLYETEPGLLEPYDEFLLYNSILTDVAAANTQVVLVESPDRVVPFTLAGKEDLARRVDADAWMHIYVAGGLDDLTVRASLYDMTEGEELDEIIIEPGFPVSYRTLARGFWDELAASIGERFAPIVQAAEATIRGLPGTTIENLPGGVFVLGETGAETVLLPTPATYTLSGALSGYIPVQETFYLSSEPAEIDLVQLTTYRFGVDSFASSFQFPGARFRYNIVPGSWFARLSATTQYVGVNFVPNQPLFSLGTSKLSTLYLDGGTLLGNLDALVRYQFALGGFLRLRHEPFGLEQDASLGGIHASVGIELAPWRRQRVLRNIRLFAEYQPSIAFTSDSDAFLERSLAWNSFPGGTVPLVYGLGWAVADLRELHVGLRLVW